MVHILSFLGLSLLGAMEYPGGYSVAGASDGQVSGWLLRCRSVGWSSIRAVTPLPERRMVEYPGGYSTAGASDGQVSGRLLHCRSVRGRVSGWLLHCRSVRGRVSGWLLRCRSVGGARPRAREKDFLRPCGSKPAELERQIRPSGLRKHFRPCGNWLILLNRPDTSNVEAGA